MMEDFDSTAQRLTMKLTLEGKGVISHERRGVVHKQLCMDTMFLDHKAFLR